MPPEFSIRSDSVDVDEIMTQIRARIREKRGVDYTEEELRQLAAVKLEKFLDPTKVRSDLVQHYQKARQSGGASMLVPPPENFAFDDHLVYGSARGASGRLIMTIRRLLNPILKLFINPNPIIHVLHRQSQINTHNEEQFVQVERVAALNYELIHNLVLEVTRLGIEVKNLKMRMESLSGRLDFSDRRARALESVVQYRPGSGPSAEPTEAAAAPGRPARRDGGDPARRDRDAARREGGAARREGDTVRREGEAVRREGDTAKREGDAVRREGDAAVPGGPIKGEAQRARRRRRRRGRSGPAGQPEPGGSGGGGEPGSQADEAESGAGAHGAGGGAGDSLPFDSREPGPAGHPAPGPGDLTDQ